MEAIRFFSAVLLVSQDAERLARFYRETLGIALEEEQHGDTLPHYGCTLGDLHFAIHPVEDFPDKKCAVGAVKLAFTVFDLEKYVVQLKEKGIETLYPIKDTGFFLSTAVIDPDGNFLEFTQLCDDWFKELSTRKADGVDVVTAWKSHNAHRCDPSFLDKIIDKQVTVPASTDVVWTAWTTEAGVESFLAPRSRIGLYPLGPYELLFDEDQDEGKRGSEGCRVLSYIPNEMLSFEWNAPPHLPEIRKERTWVSVELTPKSGSETLVRLRHHGWRDGQDWETAYQYFSKAWEVVLARLVYRYQEGPVDWANPYLP